MFYSSVVLRYLRGKKNNHHGHREDHSLQLSIKVGYKNG